MKPKATALPMTARETGTTFRVETKKKPLTAREPQAHYAEVGQPAYYAAEDPRKSVNAQRGPGAQYANMATAYPMAKGPGVISTQSGCKAERHAEVRALYAQLRGEEALKAALAPGNA